MADDDETMQVPAGKVILRSNDFLKNEVFDFHEIDQHPVNQGFAVFSAVKRAVGLTRGRINITVTIGPSTPLVRQFAGFTGSGSGEVVRFATEFSPGSRGCMESWDSVLGHRWDVLQGSTKTNETKDTAVKTMRFYEHREFGIITIRCTITALYQGFYYHHENYRELIRHNKDVSDEQESSLSFA